MLTIVLGAYMVLLLLVAWRSAKKITEPKDFFVAGGAGKAFNVTGSLLATVLGSSAIIGTMELTQRQGWSAAWLLLCGALGLAVLYPFAGRIKQMGKLTLPQMIGDFYGSGAERLSSGLIALAWLGIVAAQIIGASKILSVWMNWPVLPTQVGATALIFGYTALGGQWSVLKTDIWQGLLIWSMLIMTAVMWGNRPAAAPLPDISVSFPFDAHFSPLDLLLLLLTYASTFVVGPDIYSRIFCAENEKVARQSVLVSALLILPLAFIIPYLGMHAAALYPEAAHVFDAFVLAAKHHLPVWLSLGLILALLSAVLSSADTTLLTAALVVQQIRKGKHEPGIKSTRWWMLIFSLLSFIIAWKINSVIGTLLLGLSVYAGAFVLPLAFGIAGFRASSNWVKAGMVIGGVVGGLGKYVQSFWPQGSPYVIISAFALNFLCLLIGWHEHRKFR